MERLVRLIRLLFAAYPNARISEDNLVAYSTVLQHIPLDELEATVLQAIQMPGDFVPPPGNIVELWRKGKGIIPSAERAVRAWAEVLEGLLHMPFRAPKDEITLKVVKLLGGAASIRHSEHPDGKRRDFIKMYEQLANSEASTAREIPRFAELRAEPLMLEGE